LKKHLKPIAVFFGTSVAVSVYTTLDIVMLGFMKNDDEVGYYNAAVKIKNIVVSVVTSVGAVMLPRVSYYVEKGLKEEFHRLTVKAFNFVMLMALPISVFFVFLARESILFLSGETFLGAVLPMQVIMLTVVLIAATNIMGIQILVPMNREKIVMYSGIAGAIVNLIFNLIMIPRYGATGAAIGTLIAEMAVLLVQAFALRKMLGSLLRGIRILNLLLGSVVAFLAMELTLRLNYANSFLALLVNAVVFFGVYAIVMLIRKEPLVLQILSDVKRIVGKK
jgi:O-antigen/teichoic acid export membrane protein